MIEQAAIKNILQIKKIAYPKASTLEEKIAVWDKVISIINKKLQD